MLITITTDQLKKERKGKKTEHKIHSISKKRNVSHCKKIPVKHTQSKIEAHGRKLFIPSAFKREG